MQIKFYFIAKLLLVFFVWTLLVLFVLLILNSRKIYFTLKEIEENCIQKRRETVRTLLPIVFDLADRNNSFKAILNLNKGNFKDYLLLLIPTFFQGLFFYQWIKAGFRLTRKVLR